MVDAYLTDYEASPLDLEAVKVERITTELTFDRLEDCPVNRHLKDPSSLPFFIILDCQSGDTSKILLSLTH